VAIGRNRFRKKFLKQVEIRKRKHKREEEGKEEIIFNKGKKTDSVVVMVWARISGRPQIRIAKRRNAYGGKEEKIVVGIDAHPRSEQYFI